MSPLASSLHSQILPFPHAHSDRPGIWHPVLSRSPMRQTDKHEIVLRVDDHLARIAESGRAASSALARMPATRTEGRAP